MDALTLIEYYSRRVFFAGIALVMFMNCNSQKPETTRYEVLHYMTVCGLEGKGFCHVLRDVTTGKERAIAPKDISGLQGENWGYRRTILCTVTETKTMREDKEGEQYKVIDQEPSAVPDNSPFTVPISDSAYSYLVKKTDMLFLFNMNVHVPDILKEEVNKIMNAPRFIYGQFTLDKSNKFLNLQNIISHDEK